MSRYDVRGEPYGTVYTYRTGLTHHQPLRLPGQKFDDSTPGLEREYNIFRWYRGGWGRYTQADPLGLESDLDLFAYVGDNPISFDDPFGLCVRMCCRSIPAFTFLSARHCFFQFENSPDNRPVGLHGTQTLNGYLNAFFGTDTGTVRTGADFDKGNDPNDVCGPWAEDACKDVDTCVRRAAGYYPSPSKYFLFGPNSNTFAYSVARQCYIKPPARVFTPGQTTPPGRANWGRRH